LSLILTNKFFYTKLGQGRMKVKVLIKRSIT